jgi:sec-independent protein translocase protein TatA
MFNSLFDGPWKILIVAVLILVLFGSRKLPEAARSLGKSMRILRAEVQALPEDGAAVAGAAQSQIDALQRQLDDLKAKGAIHPGDLCDSGLTKQPSGVRHSMAVARTIQEVLHVASRLV